MCHKYFICSKVLFEIELEILKTNTEGVDFIWNSRKKSALMLNCASIFVLPFQSHSFFFSCQMHLETLFSHTFFTLFINNYCNALECHTEFSAYNNYPSSPRTKNVLSHETQQNWKTPGSGTQTSRIIHSQLTPPKTQLQPEKSFPHISWQNRAVQSSCAYHAALQGRQSHMASKSCMSDERFPPGTISPYSRRSDGLTSNKAGFLLTLDPKPWSLALVDDVQVFQAFLMSSHAGWDVSCLMKGTSNAKSLLLLGLAHLCRLTAP